MLDQNLDAAIREFVPTDGNWRELDGNFELAFGSPNPKVYYHAIFNLFERFPDDDGAGVLWSAVHGMEAIGQYEELLLQYFRRQPTLMTRTMLKRLMNSGETMIGNTPISSLLGMTD
jgi:hypothetical protein